MAAVLALWCLSAMADENGSVVAASPQPPGLRVIGSTIHVLDAKGQAESDQPGRGINSIDDCGRGFHDLDTVCPSTVGTQADDAASFQNVFGLLCQSVRPNTQD